MSVRAARSITLAPVAHDPVNWMKSELSMTASDTSRAPCASANTSGAPESCHPRSNTSAVSGVRSDGFSSTEQPAANAPMGGWKTSGMGARFGGAEGLRKYCRQEAVVAPRTNVGAGGNYYNNSHKALTRMNKLMTRLALLRPRRTAK